MDQTFIEVLVARNRNMAAAVMKVVCAILAAFSLLMVPSSLVFLLAVAIFGVAAYYSYLQEWIEYEYSYVSALSTETQRRESVSQVC